MNFFLRQARSTFFVYHTVCLANQKAYVQYKNVLNLFLTKCVFIYLYNRHMYE